MPAPSVQLMLRPGLADDARWTGVPSVTMIEAPSADMHHRRVEGRRRGHVVAVRRDAAEVDRRVVAVVSTVMVSLPLLVNLMWTAVLEPSQPLHTDAGVMASE